MDAIEIQKWTYVEDLPDDIASVRDLLRTYSSVAEHDIDSRLRRAREDAWRVAPCPSVGRWRFLRLCDYEDPCYRQVVFRLSLPGSRDVFLDLGCCVGQVLRQLRAAGVQGPQLIGTDVKPELIDIGYDLFGDRDRLGAAFVVGDMVDPDDSRLDQLRGAVTIIYAGSFFHLFNWTQQLYIGRRLVSFLKPKTRNGLVYGRHVGTTRPGEMSNGISSVYLHDRESFQQLWDEIGRLTGTRWMAEMEASQEAICLLQQRQNHLRPFSFTVYQLS
ncbi:hypothetical protein CDD80_5706 [Ophiocordyceps camponoti-rufipedis]|uniref:Methyltransferase domain-containing protein n=1 Tax=Ophiocordyceps camponoti-rufipedis TaxID=2004952 RepID=A0A2C5YMV2_9HYPO|nr:hypothetical protein CDD80_5706 [Ophiocordyceps camponoti-rufipedis]